MTTPRNSLSLRETLLVGAALGILLPAMILAAVQLTGKFENDINLRVRAPMQESANILASGIGVTIWNVDRNVAKELIEAISRNPDFVRISVTDELGQVFIERQPAVIPAGPLLHEERDVMYGGKRIGRLTLEFNPARVKQELRDDLIELAAALLAQVGMSFAVIWFLFDRRIIRPLQSLQESAQRLARGEFNQALRWQRDDELGLLAKGLDSMRSSLADLNIEREQKTLALNAELLERKRAEDALRASQAQFSAIFAASPVAMTVSRAGGAFPIIDVNTAWVRQFGLQRDAATGTSGETNGLWMHQDERRALLDALVASGEIFHQRAWLQRIDTRTAMLCEISGRVIGRDSESLVILAYEDITAKQKYEENILQLNTELENRVEDRTRKLSDALAQLTAAHTELVRSEKMAALGSLVAGVAHELNTPIGNSLTVASTMLDHSKSFGIKLSAGLKRSQLDEYVDLVRTGSDILTRNLNRAGELIASFKQVAVDQTSENRRQFSLKETVNEIVLILGTTLRKATHRVVCDIPAEIYLVSYPGPLGQVLTNLINNATLHAFDGRQAGTITIAAKSISEDWIEMTVRDDGAGIPENNMVRIFDPFFTTKLGQGGSGLGLSIVYNIVTNLLGGTIQVQSSPKTGSCFTLRVPRTAPVASPTSNAVT